MLCWVSVLVCKDDNRRCCVGLVCKDEMEGVVLGQCEDDRQTEEGKGRTQTYSSIRESRSLNRSLGNALMLLFASDLREDSRFKSAPWRQTD